jgi:hypothetical protein
MLYLPFNTCERSIMIDSYGSADRITLDITPKTVSDSKSLVNISLSQAQ